MVNTKSNENWIENWGVLIKKLAILERISHQDDLNVHSISVLFYILLANKPLKKSTSPYIYIYIYIRKKTEISVCSWTTILVVYWMTHLHI